MKQYRQEDRVSAIARLRASADANGGEPAWRNVSAELGITRDTLKAWWAKRETIEKLRVLAQPARPPSGVVAEGEDLTLLTASQFYARMMAIVGADASAVADSSPTMLPAIRKLQIELYEKTVVARKTEAAEGKGPMTPEAMERRARELVQRTPQRYRVIMAEELKKAGVG